MDYTFRSDYNTRPGDVHDKDVFAVKHVAVAGPNNTWFATRGPAFWENQKVADQGDVLSEEVAKSIFSALGRSGREYMCY